MQPHAFDKDKWSGYRGFHEKKMSLQGAIFATKQLRRKHDI
jgi:hypothetical protein